MFYTLDNRKCPSRVSLGWQSALTRWSAYQCTIPLVETRPARVYRNPTWHLQGKALGWNSRYLDARLALLQFSSSPVKRKTTKNTKGRYTLGDKSQQHVATTRRSDKSLRVYWRIFVKIFVSAKEFCRSNMLQKIKSDRIYATCCGDKILLQRQRFSQNFSRTHEAICCCDVSSRHVAATSRRTRTHGVICRRDLLLQLVA